MRTLAAVLRASQVRSAASESTRGPLDTCCMLQSIAALRATICAVHCYWRGACVSTRAYILCRLRALLHSACFDTKQSAERQLPSTLDGRADNQERAEWRVNHW